MSDLENLAVVAHAFEEADTNKLFLWGVSRGGEMAALASPSGIRIRAVARRAPCVDLPDMSDRVSRHKAGVGGGNAGLLCHGRQDRRVPVSQSQRLATALRAQGAEVELIVYERDSHLLLLHRTA